MQWIYNHLVVDRLSATFSSLSDPTRRMILDRLARGPATVSELAQPFDISQQAISKHVAYLERSRLVKKQRKGRKQFCILRPGPIREIAQWADAYRRFWEASFERLDVLLDQIEQKARNRGRKK